LTAKRKNENLFSPFESHPANLFTALKLALLAPFLAAYPRISLSTLSIKKRLPNPQKKKIAENEELAFRCGFHFYRAD
jgi:hypothetical protein